MQYFLLRHSYEVYLEFGEKTERDLREQIEDPDLRKIKIKSSWTNRHALWHFRPYLLSEAKILNSIPVNKFYLTNPVYLIPPSRLSIVPQDQHTTAAVDVIHLHRRLVTAHMSHVTGSPGWGRARCPGTPPRVHTARPGSTWPARAARMCHWRIVAPPPPHKSQTQPEVRTWAEVTLTLPSPLTAPRWIRLRGEWSCSRHTRTQRGISPGAGASLNIKIKQNVNITMMLTWTGAQGLVPEHWAADTGRGEAGGDQQADQG